MAAAAVADNDDGGNGEWNARAAGAAMMARSRAMDAAARSEAFAGVLARLLLLMVMLCSYFFIHHRREDRQQQHAPLPQNVNRLISRYGDR